MPMIGMEIEAANITVIDEQVTALVFIETSYQFSQAGLTSAGMPDHSYGLARLDGQVKIGQDGLTIIITEKQLAKLDLTSQILDRFTGGLTDARLSIQQSKDTFAGRQS